MSLPHSADGRGWCSGLRHLRACLLFLVGAACAGRGQIQLPPASPYAHSSIPPEFQVLRHYVANADSTALSTLADDSGGDELVRLLNRGLYLHRLERFEESNTALQAADALAEERYSKSITQNVAAFMVNDRVIDYDPPAVERVMVHYYGMLNYLNLGDLEGALVEARRANLFLDRYHRDSDGRRTYTLDAMVEYLAGLLHRTGGDDNDALVSLRRADQAFGAYASRYGIAAPADFGEDLRDAAVAVGVPEVADDAARRFHLGPGRDAVRTGSLGAAGELLVIVESGFTASRTEQKVFIPILKEERELIGSGEVGNIVYAAAMVAIRTVGWLNQTSREGREQVQKFEGGLLVGSLLLDATLVSFAWPSYTLDAHDIVNVSLRAGDRSLQPALVEDLSAIAARDFEERKPRIIERMLARTLFKEVSVAQAEAAGTKTGGAVGGFLARIGARGAATLTERADTRTWALLPSVIRFARAAMVAGEYPLILTYDDGTGPREIDLGVVRIDPGELTVRSVFLTGRSAGDQARFRAATANIDYVAPPRPPARRERP